LSELYLFQLPKILAAVRFLESGPPPVYIGFGSIGGKNREQKTNFKPLSNRGPPLTLDFKEEYGLYLKKHRAKRPKLSLKGECMPST